MNAFRSTQKILSLPALALFILTLFLCASCSSSVGLPPVSDPCFTLNGQDYPSQPILQDFIDRGWKLGDASEHSGDYSPTDGPSNIIPTGYHLTSGECWITAYLDVEARRDGTKPEQCKLRSLSVSGPNVDSFIIDGHELIYTDPAQLEAWLGSPDSADAEDLVSTCVYSMEDRGIKEITFHFPKTLDTVGQMLIIFDLER